MARTAAWSYKVGERGKNRVRLAEDPRRGGKLFVEFRDEEGKHRQYLSHSDRERAKQQAEEMAAAFRTVSARKTPQTLIEILNCLSRRGDAHQGVDNAAARPHGGDVVRARVGQGSEAQHHWPSRLAAVHYRPPKWEAVAAGEQAWNARWRSSNRV